MLFEPVKRKSVSEEIVGQFKTMIQTGKLRPGDKLPGEREMGKIFNVGRSSVREALLILHSIGLIRKTTEGTFINDKFDLNYLDITCSLLFNENDFIQLYEARKLIETTTGELAAAKAEPEDIEALEEIIQDMLNENVTTEEFAKLDAEFHANIALASRNKVLFEIISTFSDLLRYQVAEKLGRLKCRESGVLEKTVEEHKQILDAIKKRDKQKTREYMYNHIERGERVFLPDQSLFDEVGKRGD